MINLLFNCEFILVQGKVNILFYSIKDFFLFYPNMGIWMGMMKRIYLLIYTLRWRWGEGYWCRCEDWCASIVGMFMVLEVWMVNRWMDEWMDGDGVGNELFFSVFIIPLRFFFSLLTSTSTSTSTSTDDDDDDEQYSPDGCISDIVMGIIFKY